MPEETVSQVCLYFFFAMIKRISGVSKKVPRDRRTLNIATLVSDDSYW